MISQMEAAMTGLLTPTEISVLLDRLTKLKAYLQNLKNQNLLLTRNQWNAASAQGLLTENASYYAEMIKNQGG